MPAHLAGLQRHKRVQQAVLRHHGNALATYQGGAPFAVILQRGASEIFNGMGYTGHAGHIADAGALTCTFALHHCPGLAEGSELEINGQRHRINTGVQADENGWVTVGLIE